MEQIGPHTISIRHLMMLCPCCQHIDNVAVTVDALGNDRHGAVALKLFCPQCSLGDDYNQTVNMYEVDPLLVKGLAFLNAAGLMTTSHCSVVHDGVINDQSDNPFVIIETASPEIIACIKECVAEFVPTDSVSVRGASIMTMEDRISKNRHLYSKSALYQARHRLFIQMWVTDRTVHALTSAVHELNVLCETIARRVYVLPEDPMAYAGLRYSGKANFTNHL